MFLKTFLLTIFRRRVDEINEEITETSRFVIYIWMFCRVFGLIPIRLRKSKICEKTVWLASYSKAWAIYSWVMHIIAVGAMVFGYFDIKAKQFSQAGKRNAPVIILLIVHVILASITVIIGCKTCATHVTCLIRARKLIEKVQSLIVWRTTNKNDDKAYKIAVILVMSLWSLVTIFGLNSHLFPPDRILRYLPMYDAYFFWSNVVSFSMLGLFTTGIYSVKNMLSQVNELLNLIKKNINTKSCTTGGYGDLRTKLSSVTEAHRLVGQARGLLVKDQALMLLVALLSIVERTIVFSWLIILDTEKDLPMNALFQAVNCFCELCKLLCIVESCHRITKISDIIRKDATKLLTTIWDFGLRSDLKYCLRKMNDQTIEFTAFDIWKIDRSLIATIGGLILTNLIILLQFL